MDNIISMSEEDFSKLTYAKFIENLTIYPTKLKARKKGYEAHHIIPISIQWNKYKETHNSTISKSEYCKIVEDDRCFRLTSLEHIVIHYLLAKENGGEYIEIFSIMYNHNFIRCSEVEKLTLSNIKEVSELRKKGFKRISDERKGSVPWNKGKQGIYSKDTIEKMINNKRDYNGENNPSFGKRWYNNGVNTIYINPQKDPIPEGYVIGQAKNPKNIGGTGKVWYTNGIDNIYIYATQEPPYGYHRGRTFNPFKYRHTS